MLSQQPKALPYLFLTEMWERFGFYVVQGLLILYLTHHLNFTDQEGYYLLGMFTALAYIAPILGGMLADKVIGFQASIILGSCSLIFGYFLLTISSITTTLLYLGLAGIVLGTGLFKPSISSLLGAQYQSNDSKRDTGFTIFYIGINIGAFLAGTISGYIKEWFGWNVSFGISCVGLVIALIIFHIGIKKLLPSKIKLPSLSTIRKWQFLIYYFLALAGIYFLFIMRSIAHWLLPTTGIILLIYLTYLTLQQKEQNRKQMIILTLLILSSVVFWMLYLQMFFSINLFIDRLVNKEIFGIHLTTPVFYASESIFIILLGPLFAYLWHVISTKKHNPSSISKFILGIFFLGLAFLVLAASIYFKAFDFINPWWIFSAYFLITIGELLLSPIGLSAITSLSPKHLVGTMMGIWFVATGFGGLFAGMIADLASVPAAMTDPTNQLMIYRSAFLDYAAFAFVVSILLFFAQLMLRKYLKKSFDIMA